MKPLDQCRLYTFVDTAYLHGRDAVEVAWELCAGGSDLIQLRAKGAPEGDVLNLAQRVREVTRKAGVGLVINDWPAVAETAGDFCHLGQEDYFEARIAPGKARFGLSSHSPEQALRAVKANPAYLAVGPVYPTKTKPGARAVTLDYVRWAVVNLRLPWFAIGGITLDNVGEVLAAGAQRICVVSAILEAPSIREACQAFAARLRSSPPMSV